jgi:DnaJ family protein C protein 3
MKLKSPVIPFDFPGINDYQQAYNTDQNNQRAEEGLHKAQKLKKQAGKRDYYKILGVRR